MLGRGKKPGRPRKSLAELVADRSFLARRHGELLAGPPVDDPTLAALQALYRQAGSDRQRRRVALQFEKLCRAAPPPVGGGPDVEAAVEFEEPLEAAESPIAMMARIWGVRRGLAWWERDALGIPASEDFYAWRRRVRGY